MNRSLARTFMLPILLFLAMTPAGGFPKIIDMPGIKSRHPTSNLSTPFPSTSFLMVENGIDFATATNYVVQGTGIILGGNASGPNGAPSSATWLLTLGSARIFDSIALRFKWTMNPGSGLRASSSSKKINITASLPSSPVTKTLMPQVAAAPYGWLFHPLNVSSLTVSFNYARNQTFNVVNATVQLDGGCSWTIANITLSVMHKTTVGFCYGGCYRGLGPDQGEQVNANYVAEDMSILHSWNVSIIRTYGSTLNQEKIPSIAEIYGISTLVGVWLTGSSGDCEEKYQALNIDPSVVSGFIVGNEVLTANLMSKAALIAQINDFKTKTGRPVSTAEEWSFWDKDLIDCVDFIIVHSYPFWLNVSINDAPDKVIRDLAIVKSFTNKTIILGETGWPSGTHPRANEFVQKWFWETLLPLLSTAGIQAFMFDAFDENWKKELFEDYNVGPHWGAFTASRIAKPVVGALSSWFGKNVSLPSVNRLPTASNPPCAIIKFLDDLSKALLVVGPVAGGLIAIFLVKKHYRKIKTSMQAARQRIWQFYWKTLRHPRQVSVTAKLVPKLEWILPVFIKIYNALSMQNENINTRSEPLDATVAGLIKTFSPLFESTITSTRKKSFKANARVELFSPSGISIADASMALDLAMGETKNDWWLKFNERAMRDSIREPSTWNDLAATLRIESLDSSIIIKADVKPAVIRFGAYDQMAWHSSVLKGAPFPKNFRLQDLDLLEYCALWITPEMEMMVGNRFTSERLAKAVPAFLSFFKMFNKFYEMRAKMTTSEAIFIAFGEALAKINTIFKDQGSFQIMEQIRLADELNNMQKVNPPELTVLDRTGNCINLAILFCTVVEKLEQAKRLSTGILFSISENEGHVRPVLYCEGTAHAYELVRLKPIVEGSTQREGTFNLDTHGMIEDVTGLMNRLRDSPQSHPDKRLIWTEHVLDKIKKYVK